MKRSFTILTAALTLFAFLAIPMGMKGQTRGVETFTFSEMGYSNAADVTTVVGDDVTLTFAAGTNANNAPKYYTTGTGVRMYTGNTLEVALNNQTSDTRITAINFTFSGSYSGSLTNWTGSETSVSFTNTASGQARIQVIAVTFADGDTPQPTTYTVTFDAGEGTFVGSIDFPNASNTIEAGSYTLPSAERSGYIFNGWALGEDIYEGGASYTVSSDADFVASYTENGGGSALTALLNIESYADANGWTNGTKYTEAIVSPVTFTANGGSNTGKYYTTGEEWRYYQTESASITISIAEGYTLTSITPTYNVSNNGVLKNGSTSITSGTTVNVSGTSVTFTVGNSGSASNGQVKFTNIDVTYVSDGGTLAPSITANNVSIAYDATSGEIEYTLNNPATNGSLSVLENVDWISNAVLSSTESKVTFTTTANEANTSREGIITITYTYGDNETVSKDVTVTQAAAPLIYTTIPDLFAAATSTETSVLVTFNNWVVSGVSTNGKNVFVTDNNGNGFVIYYTTDMSSTFAAGDILSGTAVSCTLKKYNGFAELLNVNATDLTITSGGTVTVADVAMADLAGVNTGALLHYDNLTCEVTTNNAGTTTYYHLTDGTTSIQVYNAIYVFGTLVDGETYNITGVYQQFNNTKEILPRSAADIEEVGGAEPSVTVTPATVNAPFAGAEGTLALAYENIEEFISFDYYFCDANGGELEEDPDWIYAEIQEGNDTYSLYYLIDANDGAARTAYLKVYTFDDNLEEVYALVTVNQEEYVAPGVEENYMLFTGDLVEGDYLIVYDGSAMNNVVDNGRLQYEEVTAVDDVIITDNAAIVWHIAPSGDYWTIYSADANAYAASTGVKNKAQMLADGTDNMALWTVNLSNGTFDFVNKANDAANVNAYLRNNKNTAQNYGFACYGSGTGGALSLYKKVDGNTPSITVNPALVEEDVEEHDGTLDLTYVNLEITDMEDFGIQYYDAEGEETDEPDWIEVLVAEQDPTIGEGYVVSYYMLENDGQARTAYFKVFALGDEDFVYSNLITINQAGYVAPAGSNDFQLYSGALVEGDYLIVYDNGAMNTTENNNRLQFSDVYPINDLITTDDASIIWHIAPSGNYWTIYNADENAYAASTGIKNQAQMLSDGTDDMALWTVSTSEGTYEFENKERAGSSSNPNNKWLRRNGDFGFACYSTSIGGALSLYKRLDAPVTEAHTLTINGYTDDNTKDGYYLIASPVTVNPASVEGMTTGDFDLYYFDEAQDDEWRNYEATPFNLVPGKGYLYAKKATTENPTYSFELTGIPYNNQPITLSKSESGDFIGWNLVGNPFGETAVLSDNRDFYVMNSDGSDFIQGSGDIAPMQGIFVIADQNEDVLVFTPVGSIGTGPIEDFKLVLNLTKGRGIIDRAVVRFGEGRTLPKFMLNANNTKLYITEGNQDYAVVRSNNAGEMPVSFKAAENGNYTLSIETENVEVSYLHLIDNMTGTDVDLMATPSYSFEARTTDYANRFRLVFNTNGVDENTTTASFAYFNGSSWTISTMGEATLQVVDMMGRVISTQAISGNTDVNLNQATGVYMLRLVNGENVMVQKVVVR